MHIHTYAYVCLQCGGMSFFGFGGNKNNLEDELFNLKFSSKQLQKESKKVIWFVCQQEGVLAWFFV